MEQKVNDNVQSKENKACNCTKKISSLEKEIKLLKILIEQQKREIASIKKALKR